MKNKNLTLERLKAQLRNGTKYYIAKYYDRGHIRAYGRPTLEYNITLDIVQNELEGFVVCDNEQEFSQNDRDLQNILDKYTLTRKVK